MTLYSCSRNRLRQGLAQSLRRPNRESEVESKSEDLKRVDEPIYHRTNLAERVIGSIPTQVAKLEGTCKGNTLVTALLPDSREEAKAEREESQAHETDPTKICVLMIAIAGEKRPN